MAEHTLKSQTNRGITPINLLSNNAPSFSLELTQEEVVKVVSNPIQSKKFVSKKELRSKFRNDLVKMADILKIKKNYWKKLLLQKTKKNEKERKAKEIAESSNSDDDVENSSANETEEDAKEEVFFIKLLSTLG